MQAQQWEDRSDGCGLGWKVTDSKTFSATTTRTVTNVLIPPTFGMSSGTLGCETHGLANREGKIRYFVSATFGQILNDFSNGHGEYLDQYFAYQSCNSQKNTTSEVKLFIKSYLKNKNVNPDSFIRESQKWMHKSHCK